MRTLNEQTFFNQEIDASGGAQEEFTEIIDLRHAAGYSAHVTVVRSAGIIAGNCINQKSNDGIVWIDVTTTALADLASQIVPFEVADAFYAFARLKFTLATGTADYGVSLTTKGF